jgi:hypothetical protein
MSRGEIRFKSLTYRARQQKLCCINSNEQQFIMMINTFVFASVFLIHFIFT